MPLGEADIDKESRRLLVDRGEEQRRRRSQREEIADERRVCALRKREVRVASLERKSVRLQPHLQRHVQSAAELRVLRRMDVKVDEAGEQEISRWQSDQASLRLRITKCRGVAWIVGLENGGDPSCTIDADQGVLENFDRADCRGVKKGPEDRFVTNFLHGLTSSSLRKFRAGWYLIVMGRRSVRQNRKKTPVDGRAHFHRAYLETPSFSASHGARESM